MFPSEGVNLLTSASTSNNSSASKNMQNNNLHFDKPMSSYNNSSELKIMGKRKKSRTASFF